MAVSSGTILKHVKFKKSKEHSMTFKQFITNFHQEESGQDMLEYALVLLAVLAVVVTGSKTLSSTITNELNSINSAIAGLSLP